MFCRIPEEGRRLTPSSQKSESLTLDPIGRPVLILALVWGLEGLEMRRHVTRVRAPFRRVYAAVGVLQLPQYNREVIQFLLQNDTKIQCTCISVMRVVEFFVIWSSTVVKEALH
jgi:hypothetical protein